MYKILLFFFPGHGVYTVLFMTETELCRRTRIRRVRSSRVSLLMIQNATAFRVVTASHTRKRSRLITAISTGTKATTFNCSSSTSSPILREKTRQKTQSRCGHFTTITTTTTTTTVVTINISLLIN